MRAHDAHHQHPSGGRGRRPDFLGRRGEFPRDPFQDLEPGDRRAGSGPSAADPLGGPLDPRARGRGRSGGAAGPGGGGPWGPRGHHGFADHDHRGGRGPGRRAGRGDVRAAVLLLLAEEPRHGYQLIQEIAARTDGRWRPSPGAIYPALNLLEDEGLVTTTTESGRRLATLTDAGRAYVEQHADELGTPWQDAAGRPLNAARTLREALGSLAAAAQQVARTGSDDQAQRAAAILARARRDLYLLLAGETPTAPPPPAE
jgi:DNA-binding PadR family transcriptional regulator